MKREELEKDATVKHLIDMLIKIQADGFEDAIILIDSDEYLLPIGETKVRKDKESGVSSVIIFDKRRAIYNEVERAVERAFPELLGKILKGDSLEDEQEGNKNVH